MNLIKKQTIYIPANSSATFTLNGVRSVALISGLFQGYGATSLLVCTYNGSLDTIINLRTGSQVNLSQYTFSASGTTLTISSSSSSPTSLWGINISG